MEPERLHFDSDPLMLMLMVKVPPCENYWFLIAKPVDQNHLGSLVTWRFPKITSALLNQNCQGSVSCWPLPGLASDGLFSSILPHRGIMGWWLLLQQNSSTSHCHRNPSPPTWLRKLKRRTCICHLISFKKVPVWAYTFLPLVKEKLSFAYYLQSVKCLSLTMILRSKYH